ncbi:hypothetical protein, partial [Xanthomonas vasicola]|uniref:hypothetical protein n=1 Tax=Xanthomonas vasicola TaxID=56459 RepID=UPI0014028070
MSKLLISHSTTMVRVPGSLGDAGYHRDSTQDNADVKVKTEAEAEVKIKVEKEEVVVTTEGSSPPSCLKKKGNAVHQDLGRNFDDEEEEKPPPPPEAPSGAHADHNASY